MIPEQSPLRSIRVKDRTGKITVDLFQNIKAMHIDQSQKQEFIRDIGIMLLGQQLEQLIPVIKKCVDHSIAVTERLDGF